jgi:hypothetical protein
LVGVSNLSLPCSILIGSVVWRSCNHWCHVMLHCATCNTSSSLAPL